MSREGLVERNGMRKSATAILLAIALLLLWWGRLPVHAKTRAEPPSAEALLLDGLLSCAEEIRLDGCALPVSELGALYARVLQGHPELFFVAGRLSFRSAPAGEGSERTVAAVYPAYKMVGEELAAARSLYLQTVTLILSEMEAGVGARPLSEAEIVLYLHDLLADRYDYDTRAEGEANADAYSFFRDGVGICQAYALAFLALARGAGLEADFVASEAMDHAWNHVRVDGVWYHVDVTRDDPLLPDASAAGEVNHARLLRSDTGMDALGYSGYRCAAGHACTDTRFESDGRAALEAFHTPLVPLGGQWLATDAEGAPVLAAVGADGVTLAPPGDANGDGAVTPADLLLLYPSSPHRQWLRERIVGRISAF